ncbi:MAG: diguanylate cyclase [Firmicutes bacterium]|nr:diguanylate cyclase [Bacillota bacterium]
MKKSKGTNAFRLTLYYITIAGIWIVLSDRALEFVISDHALLVQWQTYKGWFFVLTTAVIFFAISNVDHKARLCIERTLTQANEKLNALIQASPLAILTLDVQGRVMSWNSAAESMFGWTEIEVLGYNNPAIPPENESLIRSLLAKALERKTNQELDTHLLQKDGNWVDVTLSVAAITSELEEPTGLVVLIADITEQKIREDQLKYLSLYDILTGLYNRAYFEQEMHRIEVGRFDSVGMIVCDVDGLKLYNDSFGHATGDALLIAAATVIKSCFRESDVVARIGGDEFAILLPNANQESVEKAFDRMQQAIRKSNNEQHDYYLSVSMGYAVSSDNSMHLLDLFKEADNNMYREKLRRSESVRHTTIQILLRALAARNFTSNENLSQMEEMAAVLAHEVGAQAERLDDIRLFTKFHDIGKVGIPESILFKVGPLTSQELDAVRRHTEIGHRIALSAPELTHLADWILKHHEWWNGMGYPLGLKEEEIPVECRILAIVDAYDALTHDRPYRKAKSHEEAMQELLLYAGQQFDPALIEIFLKLIGGDEVKNYQKDA